MGTPPQRDGHGGVEQRELAGQAHHAETREHGECDADGHPREIQLYAGDVRGEDDDAEVEQQARDAKHRDGRGSVMSATRSGNA